MNSIIRCIHIPTLLFGNDIKKFTHPCQMSEFLHKVQPILCCQFVSPLPRTNPALCRIAILRRE